MQRTGDFISRAVAPPFGEKRGAGLHALVLAVGIVAMWVTTSGLTTAKSATVLSVVFPCYLVIVLAITVFGGPLFGIAAAVTAALLENYYFIQPLHSFAISSSTDIAVLDSVLAFSITAGVAFNSFSKNARAAAHSRSQAEVLKRAAATVATFYDQPQPLLDAIGELFDLRDVRLVPTSDQSANFWHLSVNESTSLRIDAREFSPHDWSLLEMLCDRIAVSLREQELRAETVAAQAIRAADKLRTGLLRSVSHDLRTPLASIRANVSSLLSHDVVWAETERQAFLQSIEQEVDRLTRLVSDLLDASRLEAGVVTPRLVEVALDDVIASALETIDTHNRSLIITLNDTLPELKTDPTLLERVLANLISNACRFSPIDQAVTIRAGHDANVIRIEIVDRGPGADLANLATLVSPFQRDDDSAPGVGLGLSVAIGFLELLNGRAEFSETEGGGLTVMLEIPWSQA